MTPDQNGATPTGTVREQAARQQSTVSILRLTAGLGHEFNNLMQTAIGALQLVQKMIETGRASESIPFIASAMRAAQAASAINQQLVNLARPRPSSPTLVDLNEPAADILGLVRHSLPRSVSLTTDFAQGLWQTRCDPHEAELAVLDLVFGTVDAIPQARALAIETGNRLVDEKALLAGLLPGRYVCLQVTCRREASAPIPADETERPPSSATERFAALDVVRDFSRRNGGDTTWEHLGGLAVATMYLPSVDVKEG